jgi:hypothetical protein
VVNRGSMSGDEVRPRLVGSSFREVAIPAAPPTEGSSTSQHEWSFCLTLSGLLMHSRAALSLRVFLYQQRPPSERHGSLKHYSVGESEYERKLEIHGDQAYQWTGFH